MTGLKLHVCESCGSREFCGVPSICQLEESIPFCPKCKPELYQFSSGFPQTDDSGYTLAYGDGDGIEL